MPDACLTGITGFTGTTAGVTGLSVFANVLEVLLATGVVGMEGLLLAIDVLMLDLFSTIGVISGLSSDATSSESPSASGSALASRGGFPESDWMTAKVPRATKRPTARKRPISTPLPRFLVVGSRRVTSTFSFSVIVSSGRLDIQREDHHELIHKREDHRT